VPSVAYRKVIYDNLDTSNNKPFVSMKKTDSSLEMFTAHIYVEMLQPQLDPEINQLTLLA
jgi:hypothetical protein